MFDLTEEQVNFIKENFSAEEAEKMLNGKVLDDILLPIDALITYQGFDEEYFLNEFGTKATRLYDEIFSQNA